MKGAVGALTVAVLMVFAAGCGSDDSGGGSAGAGGSGGSGATGGGAGATATLTYSGKFTELTASGTAPLGDVELCAESHPSIACVMVGADATYTWPGLPAQSEILIRAKKADYIDSISFLASGTQDNTNFDGGMVRRTTAGIVYGLVGAQYDTNKASVAITVVTPDSADPKKMIAIAGATIAMSPASGTGPIYSSDSGLPDVKATATGKNGAGVIAAADPGEVVVSATVAGKTCSVGRYGWPADGGGRGVLSADTVSFLEVLCK